jgi:hypothetical protein
MRMAMIEIIIRVSKYILKSEVFDLHLLQSQSKEGNLEYYICRNSVAYIGHLTSLE